MEFKYPVRLEEAKEGGFVVTCRDLPDAITQGEDAEDAIENAEGAIQASIEFRIEKKMDIPNPSKARKNEVVVAVPILTAMKAALYLSTRGLRGACAKIALALNVDEKEARRILDPKHATKASTIERALSALGHKAILSFE